MSGDFSNLFLLHEGKLADKWTSYLPVYDRILKDYRDQKISLLEIGIQNGGSLEIWSKYFEFAERIVGCDVDENCKRLKFLDDRISVVIGDVNSPDIIAMISRHHQDFDIIVDDGSHKSDEVVTTFYNFFPKLKNNGLYIIEDVHASYWKKYGGGLNKPDSAMEFFKQLVDIVNFEHWGTEGSRIDHLANFPLFALSSETEALLGQIHEISFMNSMVVIKKVASERNTLGLRRIIGNEKSVTAHAKEFDGLELVPDTFEELIPLWRRVRSRLRILLIRA